jgi:hypothetical protein
MKVKNEIKIKGIPAQLRDLWSEYFALDNLASEYASKPLGYKKAKKAKIESMKARDRFWREIYSYYATYREKIYNKKEYSRMSYNKELDELTIRYEEESE